MKGLALMYSYKGKIWGSIISALGLAGMLIERLHPVILNPKWNAMQHYYMCMWIFLMGLAVIAYSKEKYDDERAKLVRLKAFQLTFLLLLSPLMAMGLIGAIHPKDMQMEGGDLFFFPSFALIFYLLVFNVGIYMDSVWDYEDRTPSWQHFKNLPKNGLGLLVYLLVGAITLVLLSLL